MFKDVNPKQSFPELEKNIIKFWKESKIFEKSISNRDGGKDYIFYDGPPFATGLPHYGHILAGTMKDVVPRYWTMKGFKIDRKFGWDCHGLPVEYEVEKELGITGRKDIEEKMGVSEFCEKCRSIVLRFTKEWEETVERMERWVDFKDDYKTMDATYMESIWWVFGKLWEKGLVYEGHKPMHICPRCTTPLSNFEVTQGYKDITDISATAKFKVKNLENTYILAWTTTPWTLPGNVLLAVGEDIEYAYVSHNKFDNDGKKISTENETYILAKDLISKYFGQEEGLYKIHKTVKGKDLVGLEYEPLFPYLLDMLDPLDKGCRVSTRVLKDISGNSINISLNVAVKDDENMAAKSKFIENQSDKLDKFLKQIYKVVNADFVSINDGTGVVHIAPAFGEDDYKLGQKEKLLFLVQHVALDGKFIEDIFFQPSQGRDDINYKNPLDLVDWLQNNSPDKLFKDIEVKPKDDPTKTDRKICDYLESKKLLFKKENYKHSYPHCWRCDSPLLNYATSSWFVKVEVLKEKMIEANKTIHWVPDHVGSGRFGDWLENARDWCVSRNRFWGAPIPLWRAESGETVCIGSIEELEKLSGQKVTDLHKHFVDKVTFEKDGKVYNRIPEVLDCWFESGAMPYAQMHYPFENKDKFEKNFPAEFIAEGLDQTRGWFYTLVVLGVALFGVSPFKNVIVNGLVLAEDGKKMSKRLKNYPEPSIIFEKHGADALRFYLMNSPVVKAEPLRFSEKGVEEIVKKVLLPLWNSYSFFVTYANIDKWEPIPPTPFVKGALNKLDRWILSELQLLVKEVTEQMDKYDLQKGTEPIAEFIDSLTNWYIRRSRRRFWKSENDFDKMEAYQTLYTVLTTLCQMIAPFCPAIAEEIYKNLTDEESVHLTNWPQVDKKLVDENLSQEIDLTRRIVTLGHSIRSTKNIKVRQPLSKVQVAIPEKLKRNFDLDVIAEELNVKEVEILNDASEVAQFYVSPNARVLGPKYGAKVQEIIKVAKEGKFEIMDDGTVKILEYILNHEEIEIGYKGKEGFDVASEQGIVVCLDTQVTEDLKLEGVARDFVRTIQDMRKEAGYKVDDRIAIAVETKNLLSVLDQFSDYIKKETLCNEFVNEGKFDLEKEVDVDGLSARILIRKV